MLVRMWRKGNLGALLVGMYIGTVTMENSMEVPQKIKNKTAIQSINSASGYLSEENENTSRRYLPPMFKAALFTIAKI